jgi:wobble nucleotide-excising tRNase
MEHVLGQNLPALEAATLAEVQAHIKRLGSGGEAWVADGMQRVPTVEGDAAHCPFCAQGLAGSSLFEHFRAFFSNAYSTLTHNVTGADVALGRTHAGDVPAAFERAVRVLLERRQFWSQFCDVPELTVDTAAIARDWKAAREAIAEMLARKKASPLEAITLPAEVRAQVADYEEHRNAVSAINGLVREANQRIGVVKEGAAGANVALLTSDLAKLKAVRARHSAEIAPLCQEYLRERVAKEATERERDEKRAELARHRAAVFPTYQTAINRYLQRFNAGFRLDSVAYADTRGGPTCSYNVLINNVPVPVGAAPAAPGAPSFRNTLSAGDRNTLALAFFFASLDQDPDLTRKVVVIDDPISSLDDHRTLATAQEIRNLVTRAAQVIVLSHNKPFLCRLWETADSTIRAALEVVRDGAGSTLQRWDVDQDCITEHDRRHARLRDYRAEGVGDEREVARDIRPHLEAYMRVASPEQFPPTQLLGPFINVCEQRAGTVNEVLNATRTRELKEILEYANKFHHDTNAAWETEIINQIELSGFVDRAMNFTRP